VQQALETVAAKLDARRRVAAAAAAAAPWSVRAFGGATAAPGGVVELRTEPEDGDGGSDAESDGGEAGAGQQQQQQQQEEPIQLTRAELQEMLQQAAAGGAAAAIAAAATAVARGARGTRAPEANVERGGDVGIDGSDSNDGDDGAEQRTPAQPTADATATAATATGAAAAAAPTRGVMDLRGLQIERLKYAEAGRGSVLEDWLFEVEQSCRLRDAHDSDCIRIASAFWDRSMDSWWQDQRELRARQGRSLDTWQAFADELRQTFQASGEAERAFEQLLAVRQTGSESMDAYLRRVAEIKARAGRRAQDQQRAIVVQLLVGVDAARFPFTLQAVRRSVREAEQVHEPLDFVSVRNQLAVGALNEPRLGPSGAHTAGTPKTSGSSAGNHRQASRVAALQQQLADAIREESDERSDAHDTRVASIGGAGAGHITCNKCGTSGHVSYECPSKTERRSCYNCGRTGHLKPNCPSPKKRMNGGGGSSSGGDGKSKLPNESQAKTE
jgi:hypothetical protein